MKFIEVSSKIQISQIALLANEIWRECYGALLEKAQIDYMLHQMQSVEALQHQLQNQGYHYYLLQAEGETAGYLGLQPENGRLYLSKFYLKAVCRGKGYLPQVMTFVKARAQDFGCHCYWLTVNKQNPRAIAAYQKAGMARIGQQVANIGGGFFMDDYVFEKAL